MAVDDWKEELLNNFGAQEEELKELIAREGRSGFVTCAYFSMRSRHPKREKLQCPGRCRPRSTNCCSEGGSDFGTNLASRTVSSSPLPQVVCGASVLGIDKPGGRCENVVPVGRVRERY